MKFLERGVIMSFDLGADKIYGYGCIRTGNKKSDVTKNIKNSKAYKDIITEFSNRFFDVIEEPVYDSLAFLPECSIQIDLVTGAKSNQYYKLNKIIEQSDKIRNEYIIKQDYNTAIVITSLGSLGDLENIKKYYKIFHKKKICVLCLDPTKEDGYNEYSTCGFDFKPFDISKINRANDLVAQLEESDIKDNRGRRASELTYNFITTYWLYELYRIPKTTAIAMSGYSKNGFFIKADEYEQTAMYKKHLNIMEELYTISQYAKRNRSVPANFDKVIEKYEKTGNLEKTCFDCKIPIIYPIDYKRLLLKYHGGKKELARCMKNYDEDLISAFDTWVASGKNPTEFIETTKYFKLWKLNTDTE